jgi:hypothetical protein
MGNFHCLERQILKLKTEDERNRVSVWYCELIKYYLEMLIGSRRPDGIPRKFNESVKVSSR